MPMKLYLVTKGEYSGYCVVGVYSTAEKAAAAARVYADANEVDEIDLDPESPWPVGLRRYRVWMSLDGVKSAVFQTEPSVGNSPPMITGYNKSEVLFHVWASDEQHAAKIASEQRAQMIAANNWPPA